MSSAHSLSCLFFTGPAATEIYTLSLHDALPILLAHAERALDDIQRALAEARRDRKRTGRADAIGNECRSRDRKSTRLNSSHVEISYAVFCLKKKTGLSCGSPM